MIEIKTEEEFKMQLLRCTKYMTHIGKSAEVSMEVEMSGKTVKIELSLRVVT